MNGENKVELSWNAYQRVNSNTLNNTIIQALVTYPAFAMHKKLQ
jgi:hypothetical protein